MSEIVSWLVYVNQTTGYINLITSVRGSGAPAEGLTEDGQLLKHLTPSDINELTNWTTPGQFSIEYQWFENAWYYRGLRASEYHEWEGSSPGSWVYQTSRFEEIVKSERTRRLYSCDWTQVADAPLTAEQKTSYATYRQQLRDFPPTVDMSSEPTDVQSLSWPVEPTT